ncbi:hypothetical protein DVH24_009101 [Malus domestica]|uniref:DUF599 domain-containing protein n=1 Tax=Malus domestica TaxID=3750 RepID=A0A498JNZ2_MALDO|nr:hypothetical protein DVH24_009101 [Malus domestica]
MGLDSLNLNYYLVPAGLFVLGIYHVWLLITVLYNPSRTVIGLNAVVRTQWIFSMMTDPSKNGVLTVQTLRNNIMASSLLATAAITLSSVISVFVSTSSSSESTSTQKLSSLPLSSIKYLCVLLCFLVGFICNVLATRYFAHTSFLATLPVWTDKTDYVKYVSVTLNRGSYFWSLGLRAFYLSIPMFLWIFGPIPMFVCCCLMSSALYFLDTTTSSTQLVLGSSLKEEGERTNDVESIVQSSSYILQKRKRLRKDIVLFQILRENSGREDFTHLRSPLLTADSASAS